MHPSVRAAALAFTETFEGGVDCFYLDRHDPPLVTIAFGNLVHPIELARGLEMVHVDGGYAATQDEIDADWRLIDSRKSLSISGWRAAKAIARLKMTRAGMERLFYRKLEEVNARLVSRFPAFEEWPADAQLGTISCAWASGAAWKAPRFDQCCRALNFASYRELFNGARELTGGAAVECHMRDEDDPTTPQNEYNPGLKPRNRANRILFENAQATLDTRAPIDRLVYSVRTPTPVMRPAVPLPFEPDTQGGVVTNLTEAIEVDIDDYQKREPKE